MSEEQKQAKGKLFIVSIPIGNSLDISQRAINSLRDCDIVVCEEYKDGIRLLKKHGINKEIELLNEQNENDMTHELFAHLRHGKKLALISDCGTPVFADPGLKLVQSCIRNDIPMEAVPGASSIMTSLVLSGFSLRQFLYAGFLGRDSETRLRQMKELATEPRTVAIFDTPYRLLPVLEAAKEVMPERLAYIGCNLTFNYETHHYGTFLELYDKFKEIRFKGEFVIVFQGAPLGTRPQRSDNRPPRKFGGDRPGGPRNNFDRRSGGDRDRRSGGNWDRKPGGDRDRNSGGNWDRKPGGERDRHSGDSWDRKPGGDRDRRHSGNHSSRPGGSRPPKKNFGSDKPKWKK